MRRALSRLRWQLTLSHLMAIAFTLVSMIAAALFIGTVWWAHSNDPRSQPADDARTLAYGVSALVQKATLSPDANTVQDLNSVLGLVGQGELSIVGGPGISAPEQVRSHAAFSASLLSASMNARFWLGVRRARTMTGTSPYFSYRAASTRP